MATTSGDTVAPSNGNGSSDATRIKRAQAMTVPVRKATAGGEIGSSGLTVQSGRVRDEFNKKLVGQRAVRTFREMQDNDPIVGAMLFAIDMICRESDWTVEPADAENPLAVEWAEFAWGALNDLNLAWSQVVSGIMSMLPYGWSLFEVVLKMRHGLDVPEGEASSAYDDGRVGFRKFALRAQESLEGWQFDDSGGIAGMIQAQDKGPSKIIPIEKALLFRTTAARGNPEGRSVLRNAYRPWYFKKRIEEIEAIGVERDMAGIPVAGVPPEYLDDDADDEKKAVYTLIAEMVRDLKQDEQVGIVFPRELDDKGNNLWSLELLTTGGRRQFDTDAVASRYDQRIALTAMADFLLLGHEAVGSKALGVSKMELFCKALNAYLDEVASVVNRFGIPKLMKVNLVPRDLWPKLTHGEVQDVDLDAIGAFVSAISTAGVQLDTPMENRLREMADLPQIDPALAEQ